MGSLNQIEHVVVLMMENRSFDSLLGTLYPKSAGFDGLSGEESNPDLAGQLVPVWNQPGTDSRLMTIPDPDPGELWTDMNEQLFGTATPPVPAGSQPPVPPMNGFVRNYQKQPAKPGAAPAQANAPMHYYTPQSVPALSALARAFGVSDRWHASAPCQTWPNRFFAHTGTANGYQNNTPAHFPYEMPTIYNRFEDANIDNGWKIYFHDMPQSIALTKLWPHLDHFRYYDEFVHDARQGVLPKYSFIEPRYFTDTHLPSDMHPPHPVTLGDQLIADVYNTLRAGPAWLKTLLIITFDEHGGSYDHVAPPAAVAPATPPATPFGFDRYGVRVPAVIVSPFVKAGSVIRPAGAVPFDHTSLIATVRKRFNLGAPLTAREASAPDLDIALSLADPDNVGPASVSALPYVATPGEVSGAKALPLNGMQKSLLALSQSLPAGNTDFAAHIAQLCARGPVLVQEMEQIAAAAQADVSRAVAAARSRLGKMLEQLP